MASQICSLLRSNRGVMSAVLLLALLMPACPKPSVSNPGPPQYSIILLDPREGSAEGVNVHSEVVGNIKVAAGEWHAFLWRPGATPKLTDLGTLGGKSSSAYAINDFTEVVGSSSIGGEIPWDRAFLWTEEDGMVSLGTLGGPTSVAWDINNKDQIVGEADSPDWIYASIWDSNLGLERIKGAEKGTYAFGINNGGIVVGSRHGALEYHTPSPPMARRWFSGSPDDTIPNTLGGEGAMALDVNIYGTVVGNAEKANGDIVAFQWKPPGPMKDLGSLGHCTSERYCSGVSAINTDGDKVGSAATEDGLTHAVVWKNDKIYDLNYRIPPTSGWGRLIEANDINNKGCIAGTGFQFGPDGPYEAPFLLVPAVVMSIRNPNGQEVYAGTIVHVTLALSAQAPFPLEIALSLVGLKNAARLVDDTLIVPADQSEAVFDVHTFQTDRTKRGQVVASFGGKTITMPLTVSTIIP